jgi:hypothetical protein
MTHHMFKEDLASSGKVDQGCKQKHKGEEARVDFVAVML